MVAVDSEVVYPSSYAFAERLDEASNIYRLRFHSTSHSIRSPGMEL